jgi:hypothetical protein
MLTSWLAEPARQRGYLRWGLKEVRFGGAEALVLRWLFPRCRFVVLVRHPFDAYRSARNWRLYYRWPDRYVNCATGFARHWNALTRSWLDLPVDLGQIAIRYEDLVAGSFAFDEFAAKLNLRLEPQQAFAARVGGKHKKRPLSRCERQLITAEAGQMMNEFGYLPDGTTADRHAA